MSEKTPRIRPHERPNAYIKVYGQRLGQLSLLPAAPPISREIASPEGDGLNRDLAEVMEVLDNAPGDSIS